MRVKLFPHLYSAARALHGAGIGVASAIVIVLAAPPVRVGSGAVAHFFIPAAAEVQSANLRAVHRAGQTFLTWSEPEQFVTSDSISVVALKALRAELDETRALRFRIYRSDKPIRSIEGMTALAEVPPLTCWNTEFYGGYPQPQDQALRYRVEDGQPALPRGTGLYVHNPKAPGQAYYAVTVVVNGRENRSVGSNSLSEPVPETVGQGVPVFQREERPQLFNYISGATLRYYVRWESPPNFSIENRPFDYLVAIPPHVSKPAPVMLALHAWGGNTHGYYGWWFNAEKGTILVSSNAVPYDWWTGYHERLFSTRPPKSPDDWRQGVVRPYTQTRLLSFLDWLATRYQIDLTRAFTAGASMGGSGAIMMALRHPERFAWSMSWVGIHRPLHSPTFRESYEGAYGRPEWAVKFQDGTPVWDYFDDVWYLRRDPGRDAPLLIFSNGKNDGSIGWKQAVDFVRTLQEVRQPHVFFWGQAGHGERAYMPGGTERELSLDVRKDQTLPAFTRNSMDGNPGDGSPEEGDPAGQINAYMYWDTRDAVDQPDRWEMTVGVYESAPRASTTVDVTPRRCQHFELQPGERVVWSNTSVRGARVSESGEATADEFGLVTLRGLTITTGRTRIRISRTGKGGTGVPAGVPPSTKTR